MKGTRELFFEPISLERQKDYLSRLSRCPQVTSDYSLTNLWAWAHEYGLEWAWEGDLVWIRQGRPDESFWAPVGPWEEIDWQSSFEENRDEETSFIRVPQRLAESWQTSFEDLATVEEERGHWDYIYNVEDLTKLEGKSYHKKKNLLNQFIKKYDSTYVPLEPGLIEQGKGMQDNWCTWRDCESSDILAAENRSISRIFDYWDQLSGTLGGAIIVDHVMVAYTVAEALTNEMVVIHFEKGDTQYKGVYQAINQMFLADSATHFSLVNREQDLDDPGLRKAKLSYHPAKFLKKYRVTIKGKPR
ncbi:MAG: phosphatidylglycerol lysyltransferase domain-containing protein [Desulfatiglans sp.]|nr:phosphatidylglycerol lysyltransferase domain-containing protein [Thermodesulfobacteriota bacterium]MEE4352359.1 phosphatidylglycerol lysyltransferase domain-containing protein [Desulfatiglans sp.]